MTYLKGNIKVGNFQCYQGPLGKYFPILFLRKKHPYSELFWSIFSRIRTDYGEVLRISPYSVFNPNTGKYGPEQLGMGTLFTQLIHLMYHILKCLDTL